MEESSKGGNRPPTQEKSTTKQSVPQTSGDQYKDEGPNANKFCPDCIAIRTGPLQTVSDLFDFWKYLSTLEMDEQFSIIIDDKTFEEASSN